jgi:hypothetical protein
VPALADALTEVSATAEIASLAPQTMSVAALSARPTRLRSAEGAASEVFRQAGIASLAG